MKLKDYIITLILVILSYLLYKKIRKPQLFYSSDDYPQFKLLEDNYKMIVEEIPKFDIKDVTFKRKREDWNNNGMEKLYEQLKNNNKWIKSWNVNNEDNIWFNFPLIYNNKPVGMAEKICPNTINLLKQLPIIKVCGYSLLVPKSKLDIHKDLTGPSTNSMALNLNLVGKDCSLFIKPFNNNNYYEKKHKEGKAVIFNSEQYHYATNNDSTNRIILYIDFAT